ncbi:MAG: hypothetical protein KDD62_06290 [Bdellovibrionales bacterium]|nr:hypothetical protein [Bdellovibrionales bacterium]
MSITIRELIFWIPCFVILGLMMWSASGTLAPYAATHTAPFVIQPCRYLGNLDHGIFESSYLFIDGAGRDYWHFNPILRRILYPLIAYPFMKHYGFLEGGFIANLLITIGAVFFFAAYMSKIYGAAAARASLVLLSTYPGIAYWAGLPYSYAAIVPCTLLCFVALDIARQQDSPRQYYYSAIVIGLLAVAYDLLPFFGAGLLLLLLWRMRFATLLVCFALLIAPTISTIVILYYGFDAPVQTSNSASYGTIVSSYLHPPQFEVWWSVLKDVPSIFYQNYLHSNFFVLPVSFLGALLLGHVWWKIRLSQTEIVVLVLVMGVFLFNNLAPPYQGVWQLRGTWIARLYQPVFVVYIVYLARLVAGAVKEQKKSWIPQMLVAVTVLLNSMIVFGPIFGVGPASIVYHRFYQHVQDDSAFERNLQKFGRRPLGKCKRRRGRSKAV